MDALRTPRDQLDRLVTLVRRTRRFWKQGGAMFFVGMLATVAVIVFKPRMYKSEASISYREGIRPSDLGGPEQAGDLAHKLGMKLREMVLSRSSLEKVITEFKLYNDLVEGKSMVDAVEEMRKHITFRVKDGDTFAISYEGDDRDDVQKVTQNLAMQLVSQSSKNRSEQAEVTREFLDTELRRSEIDLRDKEKALAEFLARNPEFAREAMVAVAPGTAGAGMAIRAEAAKKSVPRAVDPQLNALERESNRLKVQLGMPVARSSEPADPRLSADKAAAEQDLATAQRELTDKLSQYTEEHPDVRGAKARVKFAETRLKRITDMVVAGARQKAQVEAAAGTIDKTALENQLKKVNDEIAAYKRKTGDATAAAAPAAGTQASRIVKMETEWTRLNRDVLEARERRTQLEDKQFKASIAQSAVQSGMNDQMQIIDDAYRPITPSKPGRAVMGGIGLGASLFLSFLFALGCVLLDDRLYDRGDVERLQLAYLGAAPRTGKAARV